MRPATLLEIARRNDYPLPANDEEGLAELYDFRDFAHFIEVWILTTNALQTADGLPPGGRRLRGRGRVARRRLPRRDLLAERARAARGRLGRDLQRLLRRRRGSARAARRRGAPDAGHRRAASRSTRPSRSCATRRPTGSVGSSASAWAASRPSSRPSRTSRPSRSRVSRDWLGPACRRGRGAAVGARRTRGARRRSAAARDPRRRGPGPLAGDRRPANRARRLPDLEPAHRVVGSLDEHPLPQLVAAGARCSISTDDPAMFGTDLAGTTRPPPSSGSTRATPSRPGSRARSATRPRRRLRAVGDAFEWQVP